MQAMAFDQQQIPVPSTSLVGRSTELAQITEMLLRPGVRLVTLSGPGGVGKTRLALQIAHDIDRARAGDVHFVSLANVPDAASVLPAIARTLGINQLEAVPIEQDIAETIGHRTMLLILDNAEHVAEHLTMLATLLGQCPNLTVLVTSQVMLRLSVEHVFPVEPLILMQSTPDRFAPATTLFIERARNVRHDLPLDAASLRAIDRICKQVDGLPLAIELAAARTRLLSPATLHDRLSERLPVLVGGPRDAPKRHQTLRATLTWSHELLHTAERILFRRLAIFENGAPYDAVGPVCNATGDLGPNVEETLAALVDHSLVRIVDRPATGPRVRLLNTIREFALELLGQSDDTEAVRAVHADWFANLVIAQPDENWRSGTPELRDWTMRHEPDLENFRVSLEQLVVRDDMLTMVRLVTGLVPFWLELGHVRDGREWTQQVMPFATAAPMDVQARLNYMAAVMAIVSDELQEAHIHMQAALDLFQQLDEPRMVANSQNHLGTVYWKMGNPVEGERLQRQAIATIRTMPDDLGGAMFLANIGEHLLEQGEYNRAEPLIQEAVPVIQEHRPDALPLFQGSLACIAIRRNDLDNAGQLIEQSLNYHRDPPHRQPRALAERLCGAGQIAARRGLPEQGARLLGAALAIHERPGSVPTKSAGNEIRKTAQELRTHLDDDTFSTETVAGRTMSIPEAIDLALQIARMRSPVSPHQPSQSVADEPDLTERQLEVLKLLAAGKSNAAIAAELFVSQRTVTTHLSRIYDRLDVSTRTEAIARAAQLGLIASTDHT